MSVCVCMHVCVRVCYRKGQSEDEVHAVYKRVGSLNSSIHCKLRFGLPYEDHDVFSLMKESEKAIAPAHRSGTCSRHILQGRLVCDKQEASFPSHCCPLMQGLGCN